MKKDGRMYLGLGVLFGNSLCLFFETEQGNFECKLDGLLVVNNIVA